MASEGFDEWLLKELARAYQAARKGKRKTRDEHIFEMNAMENLIQLRDDIVGRRYRPSRGIAFITHAPVMREIFAAPFRDRVVHHFLYNMSYKWWDNRLIYDSYSCRVGKGTLFGIRRLEHHLRSASDNYHKTAYVIKLDLQGYFMSLPRKKLYERICWGLDRQFAGDKGNLYYTLKYLWKEIIFDDPVTGVKRRGGRKQWRGLPDNKSLFCQPPGKGIVIGNLSSQLLSNVYLDQLDRFIQKTLGYRNYGRYVDDFFVVVPEEKLPQALRDIEVIEDFLQGIGLTLHPRKRYIQKAERGVEFLGVKIYPWRTIPGHRFKRHFRKAAREYMMDLKDKESIISYLGYTKHFKGKRLCEKIFREVGWEYRG